MPGCSGNQNNCEMERELNPPEPKEWGLWTARITVTLKGEGIDDDTAEAIIGAHNAADDADIGDGWMVLMYTYRDEGRVDRIEAKAYAEGHKYADALRDIAAGMGLTLTATVDVDMEWQDELSGPDPDRFRD